MTRQEMLRHFDGEAISIQYGDDATAFRALFDQLEDRPNATAASVLREMWNTYS